MMIDPDKIVRIQLPPERERPPAPPPPEPVGQRQPVDDNRPPLDVRILTHLWDIVRIPVTLDEVYARTRMKWLPRARLFYAAHRSGLNSRREREARLAKCADCRMRDGSYCRSTQQSCGCPRWQAAKITYRSWLRSWGCPLGYWGGERTISRVWQWSERVVLVLAVVAALLILNAFYKRGG